MPNFYFMAVQFFYLSAICMWTGGIFIIGFAVAPVIFERSDSRTLAGEIVGKILSIFDKIVYICMAVIIITSIIKYNVWENPTLWISIRYIFIAVMSVTAIYSSAVNSPKMKRLKEEILSFDKTPSDDPARIEFNRLHKISSSIMKTDFICGLIILFFS